MRTWKEGIYGERDPSLELYRVRAGAIWDGEFGALSWDLLGKKLERAEASFAVCVCEGGGHEDWVREGRSL